MDHGQRGSLKWRWDRANRVLARIEERLPSGDPRRERRESAALAELDHVEYEEGMKYIAVMREGKDHV